MRREVMVPLRVAGLEPNTRVGVRRFSNLQGGTGISRAIDQGGPMLALLQLLFIATFGGWAAITVEDLPDYVVARQPLVLSFMVRQHGVRPLSGLNPTVEAKSGSHELTVGGAGSGDRPVHGPAHRP